MLSMKASICLKSPATRIAVPRALAVSADTKRATGIKTSALTLS